MKSKNRFQQESNKSSRVNKTTQNIKISEIMQQKWSLHAAIKSQLDLFSKRNKFNQSIENQEQQMSNKSDISREQDVDTKTQKKICLFAKKQNFKRFKQKCKYLIRKKQEIDAAKYIYQQNLMKKVLLSKVWSMDMDDTVCIQMRNIQNYLLLKKKQLFYKKFKLFYKMNKKQRIKSKYLVRLLKMNTFNKLKQLIIKSQCEIKRIKQVQILKSNKLKLKETIRQESSNKKRKYFESKIMSPKSMIVLSPKTPKIQRIISYQNISSPKELKQQSRSSIIQIRENILVDDFRNYLYSKQIKRFFNIMKLKRSGAFLSTWNKNREIKIKSKFITQLSIELKQNKLGALKYYKHYQQLMNLLLINKNKNVLTNKLASRFSYKMKRIVVKKLNQNRQKKMLNDLCSNIIVSKRLHHLQQKAFQTLKINVEKQRIKEELIKQLQLRKNLILMKKSFIRWKYYRPEYLNQTFQSDQIRISMSPRRQRQQTGASDLQKNQIKYTMLFIFFKRFMNRTKGKNDRQDLLNSYSCLLNNRISLKTQNGKILKSNIETISQGLNNLKQKLDIKTNTKQLEIYLLSSRSKVMFTNKYLDPAKKQKISTFLKINRSKKLFSNLINQTNDQFQLSSKFIKLSNHRFLNRLQKNIQIQLDIKQKSKYLIQLISKSNYIKSSFRLLNQLKSKRQKQIQNNNELDHLKMQLQVKKLIKVQEGKTKSYYLHLILKDSAWKNILKSLKLNQKKMKKISYLNQKRIKLETYLATNRTKQIFQKIKNQQKGDSEQYQQQIEQVKRQILRCQKLSFFYLLNQNHQHHKQQVVQKVSSQKLFEYAERKHKTNLQIKTFTAFKQIYQSSKKSAHKQLLFKTFQALKDTYHISVLLKRYLKQSQQITYYPQTLQQKQQFDLLQQYI